MPCWLGYLAFPLTDVRTKWIISSLDPTQHDWFIICMRFIAEMEVRRGIDRKKVGCRSLIDANLEGQVGVNKFKL